MNDHDGVPRVQCESYRIRRLLLDELSLHVVAVSGEGVTVSIEERELCRFDELSMSEAEGVADAVAIAWSEGARAVDENVRKSLGRLRHHMFW